MQTHAEPAMPVAGISRQSGQTILKSMALLGGRLIIAAAFVISGVTYGWMHAQSGTGAGFALWIVIAAG